MDMAGELNRLKARVMLRRAECDIEIDHLDAMLAELDKGKAPEGCQHPHRKEITGMGAEKREFVCPDCGAQFMEG